MFARVLGAILALTALQVPAGETEGPVLVFKAAADYDTVKENIGMAITDRGMLTSGELHVSDMLNRTGTDLGFPRPVFIKAESIEFCSAVMSHKMTQADPSNLVICPFTIALFIKTNEPEQVYVAYRRQYLAGEAETAQAEVNQLLRDIVAEALE
jgi:hypothetical protein